MKNFLIALVVLIGCFAVAAWLVLDPPWNGNSANEAVNGQKNGYMIATWKNYDDPDLNDIQIQVGTKEMDIEVPAVPVSHSISVKGHWNLHAFYIDSNTDSPSEVEVARELKNEDLEVDIGRFLPNHPGKIVCVKMSRFSDPYPYPTNDSGIKATYPPPKGLIRVGMLQCDLEELPWQAESIVINSVGTGPVDHVNLNDMPKSRDDTPEIYTYRSDRPGVPELLVTVFHGRVTEVTGGAEETSDIPYQAPPTKPSAEESGAPKEARTWEGWLFDLIFEK